MPEAQKNKRLTVLERKHRLTCIVSSHPFCKMTLLSSHWMWDSMVMRSAIGGFHESMFQVWEGFAFSFSFFVFKSKDWKWEEKGATENEMVGWHHWLNGHEFEYIPGVGDGQGGLVCCSPWGWKESDRTELNFFLRLYEPDRTLPLPWSPEVRAVFCFVFW